MQNRYPWIFLLSTLIGAFLTGTSLAQSYPQRPVKIVVGFAAGGSTDKLTRIIAQRMSDLLGHSVIVENKPGAAGNIAAEFVAGAPADGHTLFMATLSSQAINPHLYAKLKFDPLKSFEPIALVAKYPLLLVVSPQLPIKSVRDLVAHARVHPGTTFFASSGSGSPSHLAGELFKLTTGTDVRHVPYRGGSPAMMALMSNEVQFGFETIPSAMGLAKTGKLRGIAVTSNQRLGSIPDIPTVQEAEMPGFVVTSWAGLLAPAGTPREIVARLSQAVQATLAAPAISSALVADGAELAGGTPTEFQRFMSDELKAWGDIVRRSGARLD